MWIAIEAVLVFLWANTICYDLAMVNMYGSSDKIKSMIAGRNVVPAVHGIFATSIFLIEKLT